VGVDHGVTRKVDRRPEEVIERSIVEYGASETEAERAPGRRVVHFVHRSPIAGTWGDVQRVDRQVERHRELGVAAAS